MKKLTLGTAATISMLTSAHSAVIVGTNSIAFTGTATEETVFSLNLESQIVDGSGLSATPTAANVGSVTHANVANGNAWATIDPTPAGGDYFAETVGTVVFEIVLDNTYAITDFVHWSYGFGTINDNNISNVTFDYGVGDYASSTGAVALAEASTAGGSVITSIGSITADRIRITVNDNYFVPQGDGGDRVGIAEVRFIGDVVPEPSSVALLGLGGLALIFRRRK
ncbi:PEP-CTERM sorting domain-containing protein [Oceaniferula spumae]